MMNPSLAGAIAFFVFRTMISSRPDSDDGNMKDNSRWTYIDPTREEAAPIYPLMRASSELVLNATIPVEDKLLLLARLTKKMTADDHQDYSYAATHLAARIDRFESVKREFVRAFFKEQPAIGAALFDDLYLLYISTDFQDAEIPGKRTELMTQVIASHTGLW